MSYQERRVGVTRQKINAVKRQGYSTGTVQAVLNLAPVSIAVPQYRDASQSFHFRSVPEATPAPESP